MAAQGSYEQFFQNRKSKKEQNKVSQETGSYSSFKKNREEKKNNRTADEDAYSLLKRIRSREVDYKTAKELSAYGDDFAEQFKKRVANTEYEGIEDFFEKEGKRLGNLSAAYRNVKNIEKEHEAVREAEKLDKMTSEEVDSILADYDSQIEDLKDKGGFMSAVLPGGITPSKYKLNKERINALEAEAAKYRRTRDYKKAQEVTSSLPADVVDLLDKYNNLIYSQEGADFSQLASAFMGPGGEGGGANRVQYASDENAINYISKKLTESGYENFRELAEYRKYITDKEAADEQTDRWAEVAEKYPDLAFLGARATAVPAAVSGLFGTIKQTDDTADFIGGTPYSPYYTPTRARQTIDNTISEGFEGDAVFSADAKRFLYGALSSAADSAMASLSSGSLGLGRLTAGEALLGLSAANDTLVRSSEKGMTKEQAMTTAAVSMVSEILFEHLSLGKISAFESVAEQGLKNTFTNLLKESFVNMTEEMATEITNIAFDYCYNGGLSDFYQTYEAYVEQGMSPEKAKKAASSDMLKQILEAGASGSLIGGVFSGARSVGNKISYDTAVIKDGRKITEGGKLGTLIDGAADVQGDDKYKSLYESVVKSQQAAEKDADYDYSMKEYYKVGKLSERLAEATESERNTIVRSAVSDRFKSLGETADIDVLSSAVTKTVFGEKLTHKEKATLKDSKYAQRVINEAGDVYGEYSSAWTDKARADVDALYERRYSPETKKYSDENYVNRVKETVIEEGQNKTEFDKQFDLFQDYGRQGVDFETVKDTVPESAGVNERQLKAAYDLGAELNAQSKLDIVTGISAVKDGEVYVTTTAGTVRKLSELNVEAATGKLVRSAAKYDKETANAFIRGYNRSANVSSYERAFDAFYASGSTRSDVKFADAMKKYGDLVKYMDSSDVARKAFDLGRAERIKADKSIKDKKQTGQHPAKGEYQSKTVSVGEEAIDELYSAVAKKLGMDIDRVHSIVNREGRTANAQYDPTRNKMTTSATAENELQASIHELCHYAFAYNTEKMKPVKKALIAYFLSQNSESEFEEILRQYGASYEGDSRADIEEEFVADALGGMFTTEEGVQNFLEWLQDESGYKAEEKKTILQRITEWLSDIIESIRDIMNSGELNGAGKLFAKENCDELVRIRKQFLEALDGAGANYREGGAIEGDVRNSVKQKDIEYLSLIKNGDFETAQKMVDEAAKANGYDSPVLYHGTHSFGFTNFDLDKMDDKRSIFLTNNKNIASTYSGVTGTKNIGVKNRDISSLSAADIVRELNEYDKQFKIGTTEGAHHYELFDLKKTNSLIQKVNDGIEELKTKVDGLIKEYADKMAVDFDDKDAKIHRQLVDLSERLGRYDYDNLSTPIYLLLHHTDVFGRSKEIGDLEKNIRLMRQLRSRDTGDGVIVDEALGGYVIEVMDTDYARAYLENRLKQGNYSLYAKLGKSLVIDGKGALWKDIRHWTSSIEIKPSDVDIVKTDEFYELVDKKTNKTLEYGGMAVNMHTDELFNSYKERLRSLMVNKANQILRIMTEEMNTTREIAKFAKEQGFDSVVFKNILDNGGMNSEVSYEETADIYVLFDANSVKSADAVTYDENGEVIPLSERFNDENSDIRYSKKVDITNKRLTNGKGKRYNKNSTYDEFRTNGMQWAYSAGTEAGDTRHLFNGWNGKHFIIEATKRDVGFIVIEELSSTEWRKKYGRDSKIEEKGRSLHWNIDQYESAQRGPSNNSNSAQHRGKDGRTVQLSEKERLQGSSAGNLERDGQDNQEIQDGEVKDSLPINDFESLHRSNIEKVTELSRVAAQMTAHINYIGSSQTKRVLSALNIQAVARELKKEYQSKADIHKLSAALTELYEKYEAGRVPYDVATAHIDNIVDMIINESVYMKPDISDYAKEILREVRSGKIKLSEAQKAEAANFFGSYNEFRRTMMGSAVFSEEGTPLDVRWQELCDMYPGRFDRDTVDADQPIMLYEAIGELRNTYEDESGLDLDSVKAQLSAEICAKYISIPTVAQYSNEYAVKERELLESLKAEKQEYKRIYAESYRKAQSEYGGQLKKLRAEQAEEILRAKARMEQRVQNIADTRLREKKRNRLIKTVKRLDRLLRTPGKGAPSAGTNKYGQEYVHLTNIPEGLKKTVIDFCSIFIDNDAGVFTGKYTDSDNIIRKKINELRKQYQNLKQSEAYMSTVVSEEMTEKLEVLHDIVGEKRLAQLTAAELDTVNEIADHLITVINNEVEMWVNGKKTKVTAVGSAALNELSRKDMKGYILAMKGIDKLSVMNLKPVYFFEKVGGTLETLWKDILGGQDKYVRNMQFAQQRFSEVSKKYHLQDWIDDDAKTFKTAQGHEISLTRGQALLIWATWKREGKAGKDSKHLFEGGIVYPDAVKKASGKGKNKLPEVLQKVYEDGTAHRIRVEDMLKIDEWLTAEQKKYADELVSFLSNDIGAWGNEISMQLYGVNKFNEKYYIPFNSAKNYLYKGMGEDGTKLLKSEGFTKETKWGAANPLVVDDFTDVVVKHIERMSMYNSMVIPLDNFSRVWNYQERANAESDESMKDVKAAFETAWGKEYKAYVENFLRDVNGGVMSDSREFGDKWLSKFKKAAVMGSLSVMIQQPSAIVRAMSEVDVKYFVSSTFGQRKAAYEEAMKYAPVAVLKEIGGFDTVSGQSMADWMLKREYKGMDKLKAFFKDSQFRDDVLSWGPAWADRVTWAHIWLACKNEVRVKNSLTGEALLEATGKRFTEVINKTQVYDSVLSRSDAMRSKSTYMKMTTAFMAEPTTQWNMYGSAVRDFKNGDKKKGSLKVASVVGSQLLNAALVSIIYAARDDEEEETPVEKYMSQLVGNFLESLNPLSLVPLVKDIVSLVQGYDVERSDMSIFSNVVDSITNLWNDNKSGWDKVLGIAGSTFDVFGVPLKNIIRDGKALVNTVNSLPQIGDTTASGIVVAIRDELSQVPERFGYDNSKDSRLFDAFINEDEELYAEYASRYKDGKAVKNALTTQIKERYISGELTKSKAEEFLERIGLGSNEVYYKIREWDSPADESDTDESDGDSYLTLDGMKENVSDDAGGVTYSYLHEAVASGNTEQIRKEAQDLYDRGAEKEKVRSSLTSKWKKAYLDAGPYEKVRIRECLYATGAYDSLEHLDEYLKRWRDSEQK